MVLYFEDEEVVYWTKWFPVMGMLSLPANTTKRKLRGQKSGCCLSFVQNMYNKNDAHNNEILFTLTVSSPCTIIIKS